MSAAQTIQTTEPIAPAEAPREDYPTHLRTCPHCKVFAEPCETGSVLRDEAGVLVANARARALRDAKIQQGGRLAPDEVDPPYPWRPVVHRIGRLPAEKPRPSWLPFWRERE